MTEFTQPMLAAKTPDDLSVLKFPLLLSPKLDGIRATCTDQGLVSRTVKPIPSAFARRMFGPNTGCMGMDGELISGDPKAQGVFSRSTSAVMTHNCEDPLTFYVFDDYRSNKPYEDRLLNLDREIAWLESPNIRLVEQIQVDDVEELLDWEKFYLELGYEGVMVRDPLGRYKQGRSTVREGILIKIKRTLDAEARIIGFEELMHNENEAFLDERGYTKRSTEKAGKVPGDTLGALIVKDCKTGVEFNIGSGFDATLRKQIWDSKHRFEDRIVVYKYLPYGEKDKPRHPIFKGFRDIIDFD